MISFSTVVPSYNSWRTVARTLDSLLLQPEELLQQIVVVDSSDDDKTRAVLEKFRINRVRLIYLEKKTMPAVGRNIGAEHASGELLAFIDSDAYAAEDWAAAIIKACEQGHPVGGGAILLPPEQRKNSLALAQYFLQFNEFMEGQRRSLVKFVPSCNLFCEKKFFNEIGGFPEIRASEDVLFGLKVNEKTAFIFDPAIRVYHIFREEKQSYFQNQKMLGKYILIYRRDFLKTRWFQGVWPVFLVPAIAAIKFLRISTQVFFSGWRMFFCYLESLPLFLAGLFFWCAGFVDAVFEKTDLKGNG